MRISHNGTGYLNGNRIWTYGEFNPANYTLTTDAVHKTGNESITGVKTFSSNMLLTSNLGIGTTNPTEKLTVKGTVLAEKVKVNTVAGADFVFADNYKLRSLSETEAFIQKNKHLPEIAPAETMKKEGIELADMNIKLLQKIEELTLHLIEQEKIIKQLNGTLTEQNNRLLKLESGKGKP